jgi:hypothetical protein
MPRFYQLLFSFSVLSVCWLAMMGVHELGHVIGGFLTGGSVSGVVLHPLSISRTDLSVNPIPAVVVWAGPILGVLLPLVLLLVAVKLRWSQAKLIQFFVGFCLIANGAYIAGGSWEGIGDCGVMLQVGTPLWLMWGFGLLTVPSGFYLWHRLGTLQDWWRKPECISPRSAGTAFLILTAMIVLMELFSVR